MPKDSLARGAKSASFGHSASKDAPIEFHGTVATEENERYCPHGNPDGLACILCAPSEVENSQGNESHAAFIAKCQPLNDRVLVRRIVEKTDSLIVQPDQYKQPLPKGEVVAVGPYMMVGQVALAIELKPGDKIFFGEYGAESFNLDGEELLLISAYDARLRVPS